MRLHNLFENHTPEHLIEDIVDIELTEDFAVEGKIVEFAEDGSVVVELDDQAQELVDLDEETLNEFIPLAIGAAALGMTAYDAYKNYKAYKAGDITKNQLAKRVGVDAAIGITTGGIGKLASKAYKAGKAGVQAYKANKAAKITPNPVAKVDIAPPKPSATPATGAATGKATTKAGTKTGLRKSLKRLARSGMGGFNKVDYDNPLQRAIGNFNFESEDEFEPHMMYDPETGEGKMANVEADHLKMKDMGWTHDDPKTKKVEEETVDEAEYQGRKVKLNKPMQGDVKKSKVYVKNPKGNVVKVNFGHGGSSAKGKTMSIKKNNPARRKSFRARHNCENPGPKHKARYWSCKAW